MKTISSFFKAFYLLLISTLIISSPKLYALELSCPPEELIKSAELIEAKQHSFDPECWNFLSNTFTYAGLNWNVAFGTFFPSAKNVENALKQGREYFKNATLRNKNPVPTEIPNRIICDYMSTGEAFWLSAVSPPETMIPS